MTDLARAAGTFTAEPGRDEQSIGDLGFRPAALIAWWTCQAEPGSRPGNRGGIGFWTEDGCRAVAWSSDDAAISIRASQTADDAALLGLGPADGEIAMRAELHSFDGEGVTLRWATPPAERWIVHFLALGGCVTGARAGWISSDVFDPPATDMRPDLLLAVPAPTAAVELAIGMGAATGSGQAASAYAAARGSRPGSVVAAQRRGAAAIVPDSKTDSAAFGRLTSGAIEWHGARVAGRRFAYLAISGVRAKVGFARSTTAPGRRRTRVGFRPDALLAFSWGSPASRHPRRIGRLCLGAATPGSSRCASWDDCNVETERTRTHVASSDDAILVADTQTGGIHAAAGVSSLDELGFTMDWRLSDGPRRQFVYVALTGTGATEHGGALRALLSRLRRKVLGEGT